MGRRTKIPRAPDRPAGRVPTRMMTCFAHRPATPPDSPGAMPNFDSKQPLLSLANRTYENEEAAAHINQLLFLLNYYVRCFEAAVQLSEISAANIGKARIKLGENPTDPSANATLEIFDGWPVVAARDGAMSIYHFGRTLSGLDETLSQAPALSTQIPKEMRKAARAMFSSAFPSFIDARDAVAHSGGKSRNPVEQRKHVFRGSWKNEQIEFVSTNANQMEIVLVDVLNNRQYSNTWENKVVTYEISLESLRNLAAIRDKIFEAFQYLSPPSPNDELPTKPV